jgi:uncharacterized protein YcgI (DUF1989 family)
MSQLQDKLEFAIVLAEEMHRSIIPNRVFYSPFTAATLARSLMRAAKRYHRLCETECNGGSEELMALCDRNSKAIESRVTKALAPYGITAKFNGDPRGAVIKLVLPRTKRNNDFGGERYCVSQ